MTDLSPPPLHRRKLNQVLGELVDEAWPDDRLEDQR